MRICIIKGRVRCHDSRGLKFQEIAAFYTEIRVQHLKVRQKASLSTFESKEIINRDCHAYQYNGHHDQLAGVTSFNHS